MMLARASDVGVFEATPFELRGFDVGEDLTLGESLSVDDRTPALLLVCEKREREEDQCRRTNVNSSQLVCLMHAWFVRSHPFYP